MRILHEVHYKDRDSLLVVQTDDGKTRLQVRGCLELQETIQHLVKKYGNDFSQWQIAQPTKHSEFLVRKLIYQIKKIESPYPHEELCHCRMVPTQRVEDAIFSGADNLETLRRMTTASTSCGTCTPDLEKLLLFWKQ